MMPARQSNATARRVTMVLGLVALLLANYFLRSTLEDAPRYMYSFFERFYPAQIPIVFGEWPAWRWLLPMPALGGSWSATTLILTYFLERGLTPAGVWYLYNALAITVAFGATYAVFRSAVFSFTAAICIGFGTQFYHAYAVTGGIASYIFASYNLLLLLAITQVVRGVRPRRAWYVALGGSLALNVFGYEGWLDVLVLMWVATPFVFIALRRMQLSAEARRMVQITTVMTLVAIVYIIVKVTVGRGQRPGAESDILMNYDSWRAFADDLISNVFTHTYLSVSNYLPPLLVGSTAMFHVGPDALIAAQHGYHEPFLYLVPMHHVFFWRYYAGVVLVAALYALYRVTLWMWRRPSAWTLALLVFLLMILLPGSTHTMIKFRPMNAMPSMTYHVTVGVIGASLALSWLAASAWTRFRGRPLGVALVTAIWLTVFYGALARPPYLAYMAAQGGLGESLYPNPMRTLVERFGATYVLPPGLEAYRLAPYRQDQALANARAVLGELPAQLPPPSQWAPSAEDRVRTIDGATIEITGDATQSGYQIMSPAVPVKPDTRYVVRVRFDLIEGRVCGGLLTGDQQRWVVPPDGASAEYVFDSGSVDAVRVVLANCYSRDTGNPVSRFRLSGGSYGIIVAP